MSRTKNTFAAAVAPNLAPATTKAISAETSLATLTVTDLVSIITQTMQATKAPKANKPAASAVPAPVVGSISPASPKVSKSSQFIAKAVKATGKTEAEVRSAMTAAHKASAKGDWSDAGRAAYKANYDVVLKSLLGITMYS